MTTPPTTHIIIPQHPRSPLLVAVFFLALLGVAGLFYLAVRTLDDLDPVPPVSGLAAQSPTSTPANPEALLVPFAGLIIEGARDVAAQEIATARAQDRREVATAEATREAALIDAAARAVLATLVPTAEPVPTSPYRRCEGAAYGEDCYPNTPTATPSPTAPWCLDGTVSRKAGDSWKLVCRNDGTLPPLPVLPSVDPTAAAAFAACAQAVYEANEYRTDVEAAGDLLACVPAPTSAALPSPPTEES